MNGSQRLNVSAGVASVSVALVLVAIKAWALAVTGALSVAASLADSAVDLFASAAGLAGIIYAAKPPDEDHSFGHTSAEDLVALGQALLIVASAGLIGWSAVRRLAAPPALSAEGAGLVVMAASIVITCGLVVWQGRVAKATRSRIVAADRLHYVGDLIPTIGAMVALVASRRLGISWLDPIIALLACLFLVAGAYRIGIGAWNALMDRAADPSLLARLDAIITAQPGVLGYHDLKTRSAGSRTFIQVHLELDGTQSLQAAHDIGASVRRALLAAVADSEVIIHQDPR
jgi:ferrous-iron efflux pump FieF